MNEFLLLKFLHIVGFAYWLGGDLGVFYSSYIVADDTRSDHVRIAATRMLFALDQAPRICMTLMLPLGIHLGWIMGAFNFDATVMTIIWLLATGWLTMVITLHAADQSTGKALLTRFDFIFRLSLSFGLVATASVTLWSDLLIFPGWIAIKLMIFGGLVGTGLIVRVKLKPFGPAYARLARGEADAADNAAIRKSLGATRPFVVSIWIGLLASTALGLHLI